MKAIKCKKCGEHLMLLMYEDDTVFIYCSNCDNVITVFEEIKDMEYLIGDE